MCGLHLLVQDELYVVVVCQFLVGFRARIGELSALGFAPFPVAGPCLEVGGAVGVAQIAVLCVRHEPVFVVGEEVFECRRLHGAVGTLAEYRVQILVLGAVHTLVVNLWQCVQFLAQVFHAAAFRLVVDWRELPQVGILRVKGEDAYAGIGVTVGPCVCGRGVVYGQYLQDPLPGFGYPVHHALQIAEVSHAETALGAQ